MSVQHGKERSSWMILISNMFHSPFSTRKWSVVVVGEKMKASYKLLVILVFKVSERLRKRSIQIYGGYVFKAILDYRLDYSSIWPSKDIKMRFLKQESSC